MHTSGTLDTPIGTVRFVMTEASHVFLHTESRTDEAIVIRKIRYHIGFHLHLIDGAWTTNDWHEPSLSRKDTFPSDASQPARKTAREVLTKAWTEYLAANPGLSNVAERAHAQEKIVHLVDEVAELLAKLDTKNGELTSARQYLASL
jgi:hypothetical protein